MGDGVRKRLQLPVGRHQLPGALFHASLEIGIQGPDLHLGALALDGVPDGAHEQVPIEFPLDQVILRALPDRAHGGLRVVPAGEHHDRDPGSGTANVCERFESPAVGEGQVQENEVRPSAAQDLQPGSEAVRIFDEEGLLPRVADELPDQPGVAGVVLDQQQP